MKDKNSFILYKSFYPPVSFLTLVQKGKLFDAIFRYQIDGTTEVDEDIKLPFLFFVNQFKVDEEKYNEICLKRSISGKKGRESKCQQMLTKGANANKRSKCQQKEQMPANASLNDNDNDNDNVNDIINIKPKGYEKYDFSFVEDKYRNVFYKWLDYKRTRGEKYKAQSSIEASYKKLRELSNDNPEDAEKVVDNSIANNWAGIFPLRDLFSKEGINTGKIQKEGFEWK